MRPTFKRLLRLSCFVGLLATLIEPVLSAEPDIQSAANVWRSVVQDLLVTNGEMETRLAIDGVVEVDRFKFAVQNGVGKFTGDSDCDLLAEGGAYTLRRANDSSAWQIVSFKNDDLAVRHKQLGRINVNNGAGFLLFDVELHNLVNSQDFAIHDWNVESDARVSFRVNSLTEFARERFDEAILVVDPSNRFRLIESTIWRKNRQIEIKTTLTYEQDLIVPSKVSTSYRDVKNNTLSVEDRIALGVSHAPLAESEFTLDHFGLGKFSAKRQSSLRLWTIIGSSVLVAILSYFWVISRK